MSTTKNAKHPTIAALLVFCVVIITLIGLESLERRRFRETLQTRTINSLSRIRANLESEINANFYLTRGLIAYISTHPDMDEQMFRRLSRQILKNHNYIRNISLAPDNIVRFVYPLQGNTRAIGLNYKNNAEQWPAVARVITSRKTVIAGPVTLVQGGIAFISRTPIFVADDSDTQQEIEYWGLASIVIEKDLLFKAAGIYEQNLDIRIAIKGKDGLGAEGDMIDGNPAIFQNTPVLLPVNLPEGSWLLAAVPNDGWLTPSPYLLPLRIATLLIASLLGFGVYVWLRRKEQDRLSIETAWQEAKKAQIELRQNEEFLNTVIDNIPALIFVKDARDLRFLRLNKTGTEMLGYAVSDFLGKNDFDLFPESEARFFTDKDREVLSKGILIDIPEEPIETKDSGKKILHTRKIPLFDMDGAPLYLLGISEDITEQLQAKAEKEHLEKQLQQAQKLETIGKMAGGVAHDLNNILSGIINYPELLLLQLPPDSPLRKPLGQIHDSGKRAAKVVADLLTIARGVAAVKENICLNTLVKGYLASPEHQKLCSSFPHISCETRLETNLLTTSCSAVHIQKCLMNLINNGAEAFEPGVAGTILITSRNAELHQPLPGFPNIASGMYVILTVADNGMGIGPIDVEHIFDPFYTRKTMGRSGTGLGLTVVWSTIQDHRGAVTVESSPGAGTVFSLYLPATKEDPTAPPATATLARLHGRGQRILIVDDEPQQRDIASQILINLEYSTETVASGAEAIEYLKSHTVDLVILDMVMEPGLSGRQTYEAILANHPRQKAIIASGFADSEEVTKLQALGAGQYVNKPYTIEELGTAVQVALS
ncbi:MAG: response regulator [Proteobacteria bacterium]|nr:response regulator [Pseudomonadota bacterium]